MIVKILMSPLACEGGCGVSVGVVWGGCCEFGFVVDGWLVEAMTLLGQVLGLVGGWVLWVCLWEVLMVR